MIRTIAAKDVLARDKIYNSHGYCESAKWVTVTSVESHRELNPMSANFQRMFVVIRTSIFDTWMEPEQGIVIEREFPRRKETV